MLIIIIIIIKLTFNYNFDFIKMILTTLKHSKKYL